MAWFDLSVKQYSTFIGVLICMAGCGWQIYDITNDYRSNEIITKRLLSSTPSIPGITICASKIYTTIRQNRIIQDKKPNLDLINDLDISDQFNNSFRYQDIVSECQIPTENNSFVDCLDVYKIEEYLTLEDACLIFYNQTFDKLSYKVQFRENRPIQLKINKKLIQKRITFAVHSDNTTFDHFNHNFIKMSPHRYSKTSVSYSNINIESLPPPFKTQCTDYSEYEFKTKGNCVRQCLIESYQKIYNKWPPNVPVRESSLTFATYLTDQQSDKLTNKTKKTQRTVCEEKCNLGTPCYQEMFEPLIISESEQLNKNYEIFELSIIPPPYTIDFQYEIKTPAIHFLCYIASTVNLWLGVSAYPLFRWLLNMKGNLNKDKKQDKESNNNTSKYDLNHQPNNLTSNNYSDDSNRPLTNYGFQDQDRY